MLHKVAGAAGLLGWEAALGMAPGAGELGDLLPEALGERGAAEEAAEAITPHREIVKPLNEATDAWVQAGKPQDPAHPAVQKLTEEIKNYADNRDFYNKFNAKARNLDEAALARIDAANKKDFAGFPAKYDPNRPNASIAGMVNRTVYNNVTDELRQMLKHTPQRMMLDDFKGDLDMADGWIDQEREEWEDTANGLELVARPVNFDPKYRPLAKWLIRQDPKANVTWRDVAKQFPEFGTEDKAQRAFKVVKDRMEQGVIRRNPRKQQG